MTEVAEKALEAIANATVEVAVATVTEKNWKGNITQHSLTARGESIAATIEPLWQDNEKGSKLPRTAYYQAAEEHGLSTKVIKEVEKFNGDFASAVHATATEKAYSAFKKDDKREDYDIQAEIGERSKYKDHYRRHYERSVSGGPDRPRMMKADHGHHNPSITTDYRGFKQAREAYHDQAKSLLST